MTSSPFGNTHGGTTSGVSCHQLLGQHTRSDYVGPGITLYHLANIYNQTMSGLAGHHRPWSANMSMLSSPYVRIHDRMTLRVTSSLESWAIFTVERCRAWHAIIALGQHRRSDYVRREITSSRLVSTHGWTTSGMEWHHIHWATYKRWYNVRRVMSISPVDNIQG